MRWEFENPDTGDYESFDTREVDYQALWRRLGLKGGKRLAADRVIKHYHAHEDQAWRDVSARKTDFGRFNARNQSAHYLTRTEIEGAAGVLEVVDLMVERDLLEIHQKWRKPLRIIRTEPDGSITMTASYRYHPQAPFRLNVNLLRLFEESSIQL